MKALPVNPTDPSVTGPDLFAKLVPMAAHEASSLYRSVETRASFLISGERGASFLFLSSSEEKAKLLRDVMVKIESKNETLE